MIIIGCDFHSRFQQVAMLETGPQPRPRIFRMQSGSEKDEEASDPHPKFKRR
jgi:hypothetical protein